MMFLESPALTAPREIWVAWVARLESLDSRDTSVAFALKRAKLILAHIDGEEDNQ